MRIETLILLGVMALLLWKISFRSRLLPATSSDWLVLLWHELLITDEPGIIRNPEAPIHIQFVPIIAWTYDDFYNYGNPTPVAPPSYRVRKRLNILTNFDTVSYWLRDGAVFDIPEYGNIGADLWNYLSDCASRGTQIEVHGNVPDCCQKKLLEIKELSDRQLNRST